ncbi:MULTISPECIES: helix-turn-helix domain containing protein [unclassified Acinetobacter]|uniref:TetR/AcrR family transcriptional regulator n=1 Tax=unclassified Acinetobacter TaxID=196816 RepID=UPI002449B423|nr:MULTISPECIES: helix-turn-helix domain containing protein [unclassified Acinetobacter]MDH0031720.1 TetR/AcrR family transcriptional regulator [Acinetobacter sp. GD04021]MDH0887435.1 TetR/AcrR family transcriptional regulator [Acinetobacter sp. GD03873]MDH1083776.1 TetR/AcrR family transcriptional regulator [Acinetobacter sp. GD03983]MDH2190751.1 TetR/AcrR family transcriptional regulator [Acinetobacter sp. GD03645]MDH2204303.1 TetR/AcrR family transcriptional regulator [Acinetobacter sp. GD0
MPNLQISSRALSVLDYSRNLFNLYGFQEVSVDRIIRETNVAKATFYRYFQSKEKLIELCLVFQKETLEEKISNIKTAYRHSNVVDQLRKIYLLHVDLNGPYHLLFKAIFELEKLYPNAYQIVIEYRTWLLEQIWSLLLKIKTSATMEDAAIFLFIIDGSIIDGSIVELLRMNWGERQDSLLDYFLLMI